MAATSPAIVAPPRQERRDRLSKAIRLVKMCRMFEAGGEYSLSQLSEMFNVSRDTIALDMQDLSVYLHIPLTRRVQVEVWWRRMKEDDDHA